MLCCITCCVHADGSCCSSPSKLGVLTPQTVFWSQTKRAPRNLQVCNNLLPNLFYFFDLCNFFAPSLRGSQTLCQYCTVDTKLLLSPLRVHYLATAVQVLWAPLYKVHPASVQGAARLCAGYSPPLSRIRHPVPWHKAGKLLVKTLGQKSQESLQS